MKKITVLGLGPGDRKYLTLQAVSVMREAERLFLRQVYRRVQRKDGRQLDARNAHVETFFQDRARTCAGGVE